MVNAVRKYKKIISFTILIILSFNLVSAVTDAEFARALKKSLLEYFTGAGPKTLILSEIQDMLEFYLITPDVSTATLSAVIGSRSGETMEYIYNRAAGINIALPTCTDITEYGECSSNKPKYCFNGNLEDRCSLCGCDPPNSCQSDGSCQCFSETEVCDNLDSDCNLITDDGLANCQCTTGSPVEETCNNIDDNCNNQVDENLVQQCGITDSRPCTFGTETCEAGAWVDCTAIMPEVEMCTDSIDNDCDGFTDFADTDCTIALQINPNPTEPSTSITFSITQYYTSGIVTIKDYLGCTNGATICSIDLSTALSCSTTAPPLPGQYRYFACLADGEDDAILSINAPGHCSGSSSHATNDELAPAQYLHTYNEPLWQAENCDNHDWDSCSCPINSNSLERRCDNYQCNGVSGSSSCQNSGTWAAGGPWICDNTKANSGNNEQGTNGKCGYQFCQASSEASPGTLYYCYKSNSGTSTWSSVKESTETNCNDGFDNDCDNKLDGNQGANSDTDCCVITNGGIEICDNVDNNCDGQIDNGIGCNCLNGQTRACAGVCSGGTETCINGNWDTSACTMPVDDANCGAISCSNYYTQTGTESPTETEYCYNKVDITTNRCEGVNNCKDANTAYCDAQANNAAQYSCGTCKYIAASSCSDTTLGSCTNYVAGTDTGTCRECNGAGGEQTPADDSACGIIDCDGLNYYFTEGAASPTGTNYCKYRDYADITSNRCEGLGDCKDANTGDCTSYGDSTVATCGTCKYATGVCSSCTNYASGTSCSGGVDFTINIRSCIDGRSRLHIDDTRVWWEHFDYSPPGTHYGCLGVNHINGNYWNPWSSTYTISDTTGGSLSVVVKSCRSSCSMVQSPSSGNGWHTIYEFNDNPSSSSVYEADFNFNFQQMVCDGNGNCIAPADADGGGGGPPSCTQVCNAAGGTCANGETNANCVGGTGLSCSDTNHAACWCNNWAQSRVTVNGYTYTNVRSSCFQRQ